MAKWNAAKPESGLPLTAQVEREIAAVAKKIRTNDLVTGAAFLVVGTLTYAVVALLLDKWLALPAWVRQLEFLGFLTALLGLSYFALVRPLMRVVNPRYVARQVEATMPQSKNELINWVDLQEQEMAGSVKSALASRAAAGFGDADVDSAIRSRKFLWLGGTAAVLVAALAVMFLVFKGTQFGSLMTRAFNPFHSTVIASRTTIDVIEPTAPDASVADGEQIRFAVRLGGRVPDANAADKVRLKVRYNADAAEPEEIAFSKTDSLRDFELILTRGTIQNGFWYTIAAGDAETPEHRVNVRTKPMIKGYDVKYEYPAYLRIAPSGNADPTLTGYPGTKVTLQVQTNREAKSGTMTTEPRGDAGEAKIVGEKKDALLFEKVLDQPGQYRIAFSSAAGESSDGSFPYPIVILRDASPAISIEKPSDDVSELATNGLLEVDAIITDDFGIDNATLQFSVEGGPKIAGIKYLGGASFKREKDGTFPTRVEYKHSVKLFGGLKDESGDEIALKEKQVLEFWLEAKDNCTVMPHAVGKSKRYRVNLVAPPKAEDPKKQAQRETDRKNREEKHQQQEKEKQANEKREAPKDPNGKGEPEEQPKEPKPMPGGAEKGNPDPTMKPEPMPNEGEVQKRAEDLRNKIDEKNAQAGEAKSNPNAEQPDEKDPPKAGEKKMGDPMKGDGESKPGEGMQGAGENKEPGRVKPPETAEAKPEPNRKPGDETRPENQPQGDALKDAPKPEDKPGEEKKSEGMPPKEEPKPGEKPQDGQAGGGKNEQPQKSDVKPETGKAKRDGAAKPGEEKDAPKPGPGGDESMPPEERPAASKEQKPPEAGTSKQDKNGGKPPMDAGNEKPAPSPEAMKPGEESAAEKGEGGSQDKNAKGTEKPVPQPGDKSRKPTKEEIDQLTKDAKDLNSGDPDKKQAAEQKLDKAVGQENREKLQQQMKDRAAADDKKLEDAAKQQAGKEPTKEELDELKKNAKDLNSGNPERKKAAEEKLDKSVGKENREKLQREMNGGEKEDRKKIEGDADQLARDQKGAPQKPKEPTKEELDELAKKAKDLNSPDETKKKEAEQRVDEAIGKNARQQMQKDMKEKAAAQSGAENKKAEDAAKQAAKAEAEKTPGAKPKEPTKEEIEQIAKDAKDLNSGDPAAKKAAEEKLDKSIGKDAREQLQKDQKAMRDVAAQKAQEQRDNLDKLAKDAAKKDEQPKGKGPTEDQLDQLAKDAKDLNSDDAAKKQAAEKKLDDAVGKEAREQMQKEMKENADAKAAADKKKVEELAKKASKPPSKEEVAQLAEDAKKLDSPDAEQKKAAEEKLDKALGKDAREQLQQEMKDLQGDDPQKAKEARERLEKMAKEMQGKNPSKDWNPGGAGGKGSEEKPLIDNPENRLKTAELQLDDFKKYRGDKQFLRESGMTDADYEKFLKGYEESVRRKRDEVEQAKLNPEQARQKATATVGSNDAGGGRVKGGTEAGTAPAVGGPSFAPPGFSDAQRDFAREAREALERAKKK